MAYKWGNPMLTSSKSAHLLHPGVSQSLRGAPQVVANWRANRKEKAVWAPPQESSWKYLYSPTYHVLLCSGQVLDEPSIHNGIKNDDQANLQPAESTELFRKRSIRKRLIWKRSLRKRSIGKLSFQKQHSWIKFYWLESNYKLLRVSQSTSKRF